MNVDLEAAFSAGLRTNFELGRRDDGADAHASDLGKCKLAVWFRRNGHAEMKNDDRGLQMLLKGLHDEDYIVDQLSTGLGSSGWRIIRSGTLELDSDLTGHLDIEIARMPCPKCEQFMALDLDTLFYCENCDLNEECVPDHTTQFAYIEIKTTQWKERWEHLGEIGKRGFPIKTKILPGPRSEPSRTHRLQALAYVMRRRYAGMREAMPYAIFQWDRALNGFKQYPKAGEWYDPKDPQWLALHDQETADVLSLTAPGTDPIKTGIATLNADGELEGKAPEEWMHSYCNYFQCALNTNKLNPKFSGATEDAF